MSDERMEEILSELKAEHIRLSEQVKGALKRIDEQTKLVESLRDIASSVKVLAMEIQQTKDKVQLLSDEINTIKEKPAKRWETVVVGILSAVVTGTVAFVLAKVGLK